jgi:RNA polymerase sigma-70 factor (ECF subfamily)
MGGTTIMTATQPEDDFVHSASTNALDDQALLAALRNGDEYAFVHLLDRYGGMMVRLALIYVPSRAVAEEVVQETWLAVFQGLSRFEERSSLKTWMLRILTNRAKTRGEREGRSVPFSALEDRDLVPTEPAVAADRFLPPDHERWPGHWSSAPQRWDALPEQQLLAQETRAYIDTTIMALPVNQRIVITLRDIDGLSADEVCSMLTISESNQRVLLHRARSKVRAALEHYLTAAELA